MCITRRNPTEPSRPRGGGNNDRGVHLLDHHLVVTDAVHIAFLVKPPVVQVGPIVGRQLVEAGVLGLGQRFLRAGFGDREGGVPRQRTHDGKIVAGDQPKVSGQTQPNDAGRAYSDHQNTATRGRIDFDLHRVSIAWSLFFSNHDFG